MNSNRYQTSNVNIASQYSIGVACDSNSKEWTNFSMPLNRNSKEVKDLEREGFKVIFPAELSEDAIAQMDEQERRRYEINKNNALIVDPKEGCRSLELASAIATHYYSSCSGTITGVDYKENALVVFPYGDFDATTHKALHDTFSKLGYTSSLSGCQIAVASDVPYPCVKKSKFEEIYEKAKDKIKSVKKNIGLEKGQISAARNNDSLLM